MKIVGAGTEVTFTGEKVREVDGFRTAGVLETIDTTGDR